MKKLNLALTSQETDDLISAVGIWERDIDKKENPNTAKELKTLLKKLWKHNKRYRA